MNTELLGQDKNVVKIKVNFEADEFVDALKKALRELSRDLNIPGFRRGHAPRKVIEMRVGRDALYNETLEKLLSNAVPQILEDYDLETIDQPSLLSAGDIREGQPVSCELSFEVMPEVKLPEIGEIEVEKVRTDVTDDMLEKLIDRLRRDRSSLNPVERPVEANDVVTVTFRVRVLEEGAEETAPRKNEIDLADENVRPAIREALLGHSIGDVVETEFDVEPDYQDKKVAGKRIHYTMTLESAVERVLPELGEEFYKKLFGDETEVLTEEAFRSKMRSDLAASLERENGDDAALRALEELVRRSELEVPVSMIKREAATLRRRDEQEAKERYGMELHQVLGPKNDHWEQDYLKILDTRAENLVRRTLVLNAVAKKYDVGIEQEDVEAELERRASLYGIDRNSLAAYFYKNEKAMDQLTNEVYQDKVLRQVLSLVKVREVAELSVPQKEIKEGQPQEQR